ncbi:MAG: PD-(D/E)XK nuclease family transposase, partial [Bacilli bacterium]
MIEKRILPLTSDRVFKRFMENDKNREYLVELISQIVGIERKLIREKIVFKPTEMNNKNKQLIADVIVEVENHTINIEMNSSLSSALLYKNAMYIANILASTPIKGQRYNTDKIA